ncbi:MAG: sigma-70 family RNA polymerase sigma factor [Chitinophagaceae bacterium]|nr:MAG: sigma-70 family RNA polymerase sigma factor [Chitinophagaceae bacterium]
MWVGVLLDRYLHLIFGVCMKYLKNQEDAKDAAQQICLEVLKILPRHRVAYFKPWLYQVAKNHCLMELRRSGRMNILPLSAKNEMGNIGEQNTKADLMMVEIKEAHLHQALEQLNEAQRTCVNLFYLQDKTYQGVSEETGFSMLQVKSHIQNGKRNLKTIIQRMEKEENRQETKKH